MAMQTYVFYKKEDEPTLEKLQTEISAAGFEYQLPENFKLNNKEPTFVEGTFENLEASFDYLQDPYDEEDWEWEGNDIEILNSPEVISVFNTYSNAQEITGMLVVSSVLSVITSGPILSDFFADELVEPKSAVEFAKDIIENSRDQFNGPSKMRGNKV